MADAAEAVERFAAGRKRGDLDTDQMLLFASVRALEMIGEAASRVTTETQAAVPDIPWTSIVGMRNRLVHGYFDIDLDVVWKTVTEEIPPLHSALRQLLGKQ